MSAKYELLKKLVVAAGLKKRWLSATTEELLENRRKQNKKNRIPALKDEAFEFSRIEVNGFPVLKLIHKERTDRANLFLIGGGMISAPRPGSIKKALRFARERKRGLLCPVRQSGSKTEDEPMPVINLLLEGLGLGFLLYLICAIGIRNGAIGMVHLYDQKVQERVIQFGMTTQKAIQRRGALFRGLCLPAYMAYVLVCVWVINGTRGFWPGFWQGFVILSIMNLIDRLLIDEYWVGHAALPCQGYLRCCS